MTEASIEVIVEGSDDRAVLSTLLRRRGFENFQFTSLSDRQVSRDIAIAAALKSVATTVAFIFDADDSVDATWRELARQLGTAEVAPFPNNGGVFTVDEKTIGVWLMPDCVSAGAIESFLLPAAKNTSGLMTHARSVVNELPTKPFWRQNGTSPADQRRSDKAVLRTWLAWQEDPGHPFGRAIDRGYFDVNAPAFSPFLLWFGRLVGR